MGQFVVGDVLAGKYEIKAILGAGGMGTVYRARQLDLGRDVAIKVPMPQALEIPGFLARFSREARLVAKLVHDNIVQVYEYQESQDNVYIVMEFVEGQDLKAMLGKPPADLKVKDLAIILRASCEGLAHAHEAGIVHRDIKPHNIMVAQTSRGRWRVKIMDFGIAHMDANQHATMLGGEQLTVTGQAIGTPSYMSPEQIRGTGVTSQSDIYSFGCVIHYCFTRQTPFAGSGFTVAASHLSDAPPSVRLAVPALPPELEQLIFECLAKDPAERPSDASELGERIYKCLEPMFEEPMASLWPGASEAGGGTEAVKPTAAMEPTLGATVPTGTGTSAKTQMDSPGPSSDRRPIPAPGQFPAARRDVTQTSPTNTAPGNVSDATIPYAPVSVSTAEAPVMPPPAAGGSKLPLILAGVLIPLLALGVGVGVMVAGGKKPVPTPTPTPTTTPSPTPAPDETPVATAVVSTPTGTTVAETPKVAGTPTPVPTPTQSPAIARAEKLKQDLTEIQASGASRENWLEGVRVWRESFRDRSVMDAPEVVAVRSEIARWLALSPPMIAIETSAPFTIGTNDSGVSGEGPMHNVRLSPYSMGVFEVTALEFATFLNNTSDENKALFKPANGLNVVEDGKGGFRPAEDKELHPANGVSWEAASAYARWLADSTKQGYRLPTEAEWEVAARYPTRGQYPWGDSEPSDDRANRNDTGTVAVIEKRDGAHKLGFHHQAGNVAEWVADWYDEGTYLESEKAGEGVMDPKGPATAPRGRAKKVLRGGGFKAFGPQDLRNSARGSAEPTDAEPDFGFRLALNP